jgi:hypothetical protein
MIPDKRPMLDASTSDILNNILAAVYRSLLQYTIESWPWTDPEDLVEQTAIREMASRQQTLVKRLAELIDARGQVVDFGSYPDWSELHYVSLDYLLGKIIADKQRAIATIVSALERLRVDPEAASLAEETLRVEREQLARIEAMAAARRRAVSA